MANAVADGKITVVPEVLVAGGGGAIEGLAATLMRTLGTGGNGNGRGHGHQPDLPGEPTVDVPVPVDAPAGETPRGRVSDEC